MDLFVDGSCERRRGGGGGGGGDEGVKQVSCSSRNAMIDDRQRGAAEGKSFASRIVREPYVDELLEFVDDIDEREIADCMAMVYLRQYSNEEYMLTNVILLVYIYIGGN